MSLKLRVAAAQFAIGSDLEPNLATCQRIVAQAAQDCAPDVLVLPEFCNHLAWYTDADHAWSVAVDLDGAWVQALAATVAQHQLVLMVNCTVRRENGRITGTNILIDQAGTIVATSDKQVLMGNENNFLTRATCNSDIVTRGNTNFGLYSCMSGVINETPRGLSLRGAQVLLNSLNSFADDEGSLHVPVRAAENKVFVVAANKVGPLVPPEMAAIVAERMHIDPSDLDGAGDSQIVAPDGTVLALAPSTGEAIVWADIDPTEANDKSRPDGTDVFAARRPDLYRPISQPTPEYTNPPLAESVQVATFQPQMTETAAIDELCAILPAWGDRGLKMVVLPELFFLPNGLMVDGAAAANLSRLLVKQVSEALQQLSAEILISTSIVENQSHIGVIIGADGVLLRQPQLHPCKRHAWVRELGQTTNSLDVGWGRIGLAVGSDSIFPETYRLLALQDVAVVAAPLHLQETWELKTGLVERSAENRLTIIAASRPTPHGSSAIFTPDPDFTLWTPWENRPFDGNINYPIVTKMTHPHGLLTTTVYPKASANRTITQQTDVVASRPWRLVDAITPA